MSPKGLKVFHSTAESFSISTTIPAAACARESIRSLLLEGR
jgi:hypothetical protein